MIAVVVRAMVVVEDLTCEGLILPGLRPFHVSLRLLSILSRSEGL